MEPWIAAYERSDINDYFPHFKTQIGRKVKNLPSTTSRWAAIFRHPFGDNQLSCVKSSLADFLFLVRFAFWRVENNLNPFETGGAVAASCAVVAMRPEVPSRVVNGNLSIIGDNRIAIIKLSIIVIAIKTCSALSLSLYDHFAGYRIIER